MRPLVTYALRLTVSDKDSTMKPFINEIGRGANTVQGGELYVYKARSYQVFCTCHRCYH